MAAAGVRMTTIAERFWAKVQKGENCWTWQASRMGSGYGQFCPSGRRSVVGSHRFSWELHNGSIPQGLCVLHRCDNKLCVRPDHLWLGTKAENTADMMAKGRHRFIVQSGDKSRQHTDPSVCVRGERHGNAKLTEAMVVEARARYAAGGVTYQSLAADYGVSMAGIRFAIRRIYWRHVA